MATPLPPPVSAFDILQTGGAFAGFVSLLWMIGTQTFGSYDARTIRRSLDQHQATIMSLVRKIDDLKDK